MTYFLGRDVNLHMTTEHIYYAVSGSYNANAMTAISGASTTNIGAVPALTIIPNRGTGIATTTKITDVTGLDVSPGTLTEDLSYMGQNTNLTAEIKKEFVVTVTRKVSTNAFDMLYNYARDGVYDSGGSADTITGTPTVHDGLTTSKNQNFGYRLYVTFKDGTEVMAIPNCCVTAHTHTVTPDAAQEETIEFYGYVQPILVSGTAETELVALTAASAI